MTRIRGIIKDSGNRPIVGQLTVKLDDPIADSSTLPDSLLTEYPHTYALPNGLIDIDLPESQSRLTTYHFVVEALKPTEQYYLADSGAQYFGPTCQKQGAYYTGTTYVQGISRLLIRQIGNTAVIVSDFHASVPATEFVDFALLQPTGITRDTLDTGALRVAQLLSSLYLDVLKNLFKPRGVYVATATYEKLNIVTFEGSSYLYVNPVPHTGIAPPDTDYWQLIAAGGEGGGPIDTTGLAKLAATQSFTRAQRFTPTPLISAPVISLNAALANYYTLNLEHEAPTLANPSNLAPGTFFEVRITRNGAVAGPTLNFGSSYKFPEGTNTALSLQSGSIDILRCRSMNDDPNMLCELIKGWTGGSGC